MHGQQDNKKYIHGVVLRPMQRRNLQSFES